MSTKLYVVTGGAGFIGSHIVKELNLRDINKILVVDDLLNGDKCKNIADCRITDYMHKSEFLRRVQDRCFAGDIGGISHQGACTDTMNNDGRYMMKNNTSYSKALYQFAVGKAIPFVYASSAAVYGVDSNFVLGQEAPVNVYGFSKSVFDKLVLSDMHNHVSTVVGLRYFNVYGSQEAHKGPMRSMVTQLIDQVVDSGEMRLFKGTGEVKDGEQKRDFIHVNNVVDINLHFLLGGMKKGVFNVGTGVARSFNDVARSVKASLKKGKVKYIPFPKELEGKYQNFTQADINPLRASGYQQEFLSLEDGVAKVVQERGGM